MATTLDTRLPLYGKKHALNLSSASTNNEIAFGLNFGTQAIVFIISRSLLWCQVFSPAKQVQLPEGTRSVAVVAGNRNLGLYFAALPADPLFSLFVAAYQAPLYLTPMVAGWFADRSRHP